MTGQLSLLKPQLRERCSQKEHAGAAGLAGIDIVEHSAERLLVELHRFGAGSPADRSARIVELQRAVKVPRQAIVA